MQALPIQAVERQERRCPSSRAGLKAMSGGRLRGPDWIYRQIVDSSDDAILSKDRRAIITTWNAGAERLYGYTAQEAIGRPVGLIIPDHRRGEETEILATALRGERIGHYETERRDKTGRLIDVSLAVSALRDEAGKVIGATTIARDIGERRRMERRLRYLADHDALTGLLNRRRFADELEQRLQHAASHGRTGAVLLIDVDHFKLVNDSFGHRQGDLLLHRVAKALQRRTRRTSDVVARLGGDEFGLLLVDVEPPEAVEVGRKLVSALAVTHHRRAVTVSIGVTPFTPGGQVRVDDLMAAADLALYEAKEGGRNQLAVRDNGTGVPRQS